MRICRAGAQASTRTKAFQEAIIGIIKTTVLALGAVGTLGVAGFFALGQYSKSGSAPGLVDGSLAPCPDSPNCVSSEPGTPEEKSVTPLPLDSWDRLETVITALGGTITVSTPDYIAAEFTSDTFGFVDDLELRRAADVVHVRSASRVGYSDGGVNAARVARLYEMSDA